MPKWLEVALRLAAELLDRRRATPERKVHRNQPIKPGLPIVPLDPGRTRTVKPKRHARLRPPKHQR